MEVHCILPSPTFDGYRQSRKKEIASKYIALLCFAQFFRISIAKTSLAQTFLMGVASRRG